MMPGVVLIRCEGANGGRFGSGFFIRPGIVVTNFHVVRNMLKGTAQMTVSSVDSEPPTWPITEVIAYDADSDLALLAVPGATRAERPSLPIATSLEKIRIGQKVYALGDPEGLTGTISEGIVSANLRKDGDTHFVQLTAPISPGSSGGPVVSAQGEVIGVAVGMLTEGQNLNFAVAAPSILPLLEKLDPRRRGPTMLAGNRADSWRVPAPPPPVSSGNIAARSGDSAKPSPAPKPPSRTKAAPKGQPIGTGRGSGKAAEEDDEEYLGYGDTPIVRSFARLEKYARQRTGTPVVLADVRITNISGSSRTQALDVMEIATKKRNAGTPLVFRVSDTQHAQQIKEYIGLFSGLPVQLHFRVLAGTGIGDDPFVCEVYGVTWFDKEDKARAYTGRRY